ncbi:maturase K-like [Lolium perenne]|uniref:maturase K-like n=1 Tax=Lolium perenne TaxID=4522 RepID=UPI003A99F0E9
MGSPTEDRGGRLIGVVPHCCRRTLSQAGLRRLPPSRDRGSKKEAGYEAFVVNGWNNWHMNSRLKDHVGDVDSVHNQAMKKCVDLLRRDQHIDVAINIQSDAARKAYFTRLNASIDTSRLLLKQELPFLGHDESKDSFNKGNFLEVRDFLAEHDPVVGKVMGKDAAKNAMMGCPEVQKDIAEGFAHVIVQSILKEFPELIPHLHPNQDRLLDYKIGFYSEFYSQILSEGFAIVVETPFSLRELPCPKEKEIPKFQNLHSIHSIFSFLEDKFVHLDYLSHIEIPYPIHLEILVQLLQYRIQDVPSLHLLRFFLNNYSNWNSFITSMKSIFLLKKENKRLFRFLYNSYVSEYEFFLLFLHKQSSCLPLAASGTFLERIHFSKKMEHFWIMYPGFFRKTIWFFMDPLMHYVRYNFNPIMFLESV